MTAAEVAFGTGVVEDEEWERERKALPASRALAAFDGGKPVALAGAYKFDLTIPGGELPCAGVTWVGVMPTHRRRGILRDLMRRELEDVHGWGEPIAALWASEASIYGRFGYGHAAPGGAGEVGPGALRVARGGDRLGPARRRRRGVRALSAGRTSAFARRGRGCSRATSAGGRSIDSPTPKAGGAARAGSSTPPSSSTARSRGTRTTGSRMSGRTAFRRAKCA